MAGATETADIAETPGLDGLIWGYRFGEDGSSEPLDGPGAMRALERQESWVWLHFDLIDGRARDALNKLPVLSAGTRDLLLGTDPRQRIETHDQTIAGVIADFERADELDPRRMATLRFCMVPHAFISARRSPLHTTSELDYAVRSGRRLAGVLHLFDSIVRGFADALTSVTHGLSEELDAIEDELLDVREPGDFESLGSVRRAAVRLRRQATPLQAMLHKLLTQPPPWFTPDAAEDCVRVAHRVDSVCADLAALQERAHALQEELASRQTAVTNRRLMLLSVLSAVMLPPTLISGIFGMNVDGLPFKDDSPLGFIVTIAMMSVSVAILLFALRRMKMV